MRAVTTTMCGKPSSESSKSPKVAITLLLVVLAFLGCYHWTPVLYRLDVEAAHPHQPLGCSL